MADAIVRVVDNRAVVTGGGPELLSVLFARLAQIKAELLSAIATGDTGLADQLQADIDQLEIDVGGKQPSALNLTALSGLSFLSNNLIYINNSGQLALAPLTSFGRSLVDDADATAGRSTLGLTRADQASAEAGTSTALSMTPQAATWHFNARVPSYWRTTLLPLTTTAAVREALSVPSIADLTGEATTRAGADTAIHGALDPIVPVIKEIGTQLLFSVADDSGFEHFSVDEAGADIVGIRLEPSGDSALQIITRDGFEVFNSEDPLIAASEDVVTGDISRLWIGGLGDEGFIIAADVESAGLPEVRALVSDDPSFTNLIFASDPVKPTLTQAADGLWKSIKLAVSGLRPDKTYYYRLQVGGLDSPTRNVRTLPRRGQPAAFRLGFGSCSELKSNNRAMSLEAAATDDLALFVHLGDLMYSDIEVDDVRLQRSLITRPFRDHPSGKALIATTAVAYIDDDHDRAGDDCHWDSAYAGTNFETVSANSKLAFRETVPHYPLLHPDILAQDFPIAHCRVLLMDTRSQRRYEIGTPTCLGHKSGHEYVDQLSLIKDALRAADAAGVARVFLCSPCGWGDALDGWEDKFPAEQAALCDFIRDELMVPVTLLVGDIHHCAIDDGSNTDKSSGGGLTMAQIVSSPLRKNGTLSLGGPHTWMGSPVAYLDDPEAYAVLQVDEAGHWTNTFKGRPYTGVVPTELGVFSSLDEAPAVQFASPTLAAPVGPLTVDVERTWLGARGQSVAWASSNGQSGILETRPNSRTTPLEVAVPAGGVTLTLSSPTGGLTLGGQTVLTITTL